MDTPATIAPAAPRVDRTLALRSAWVWPAQIAVLALAGFLYVFNLTVSGYANTFYAMAAQAASQSWSSWFWGSLDTSNFITVDKPPLATMLTGLSVRVFGLSPWSILLPEALCGVATIAVLFLLVRRYAGPVAATIAALVAALTPAAVLMFRYNNPDALLTLLLVLAAWSFMRAVENGRLRWIILAALLVGLAFNTKFLQGYLILPAFAVVYLMAAPGSVGKRLVALGVAAVSVLLFSSWWVLAVQLTPADMRPYVGGSTDGTALQLLFGYDGLGRIFGELTGGIGRPTITNVPGATAPVYQFGGQPGLLRLFNNDFGGQVAWLLPFAAIGAAASLLLRRGRPRTDLPRAAVLMWTLWLAVHAVVFSIMGGIIHSYYAVVMAPAIGALVGTGTVDLWHARETNRRLAGLALAAAIGTTAALGWTLLNRTPNFLPGLSSVVLVVGLCAAVVIALLALMPDELPSRTLRYAGAATLGAATVGLAVLLAGPAAYAFDTMDTSYNGGDPAAGPAYARAVFPGLPGFPLQGPRPVGRGSQPGDGGPSKPGLGSLPSNGFVVRAPGGMNDADLAYLVANRGNARWIVAASTSTQAAPIQLATGLPVMAMGGFNGADPTPTQAQLEQYIHDGELRFVIADADGGGSFGQGRGQASGLRGWVRTNCSVVIVNGGSADDVYDCAGAA